MQRWLPILSLIIPVTFGVGCSSLISRPAGLHAPRNQQLASNRSIEKNPVNQAEPAQVRQAKPDGSEINWDTETNRDALNQTPNGFSKTPRLGVENAGLEGTLTIAEDGEAGSFRLVDPTEIEASDQLPAFAENNLMPTDIADNLVSVEQAPVSRGGARRSVVAETAGVADRSRESVDSDQSPTVLSAVPQAISRPVVYEQPEGDNASTQANRLQRYEPNLATGEQGAARLIDAAPLSEGRILRPPVHRSPETLLNTPSAGVPRTDSPGTASPSMQLLMDDENADEEQRDGEPHSSSNDLRTISFGPAGPTDTWQTVMLTSWNPEYEDEVRRNRIFPLALPAIQVADVPTDESDADLSSGGATAAGFESPIASVSRQPVMEPRDWRKLLGQTVAQLERQTEGAAAAEGGAARARDIRLEIQKRLLRLSAGDIEGALQPISGLSAQEQRFWHHQLASLGLFLGHGYQRIGTSTLSPTVAAEVAESLQQARRELTKLAPLKIAAAKLCRSVDGFGQYQELPSEFTSGQQAIVYCELVNFSARAETGEATESSDVHFVARLRGGYQILDQDHQIVAQQMFPTIQDRSRNVRTDFYLYFPVTIPELPPGNYQLNVSVADLNAHKQAELDRPLAIEILPDEKSSVARQGNSSELK